MSTVVPTRSRTLVVDDDEVIRELLLVLLDLHGHDVHVVDSGGAALQWLAEGSAPDLILTDVQMPGTVSGELLAALREKISPPTRIIGMSGSRPRQPLLDSMDAFVLKPFGYADLEKVLNALPLPEQAKKRKTLLPSSPVKAPVRKEENQQHREEHQEGDRQQAAPRRENLEGSNAEAPVLDESIFRSLRATFRSKQLAELYTMTLGDVATRQNSMLAYAEAGDLAAVQREAHSLKGLCGMVGARELGALAAAVEGGTDLDTSALQDISAACARLRRMLDTKFANHIAPAGEHE